MEGNLVITGAQLLIFMAGVLAVMGTMAKIILAEKDDTIKACRAETARVVADATTAIEKVEVDRNFWRDQTLDLQTGHAKTIENLVTIVGLIRDLVQDQRIGRSGA